MYVQQLIDELGKHKVSQNETELMKHSRDESIHAAVKPEIVCFPETKDDVATILEVASVHLIPVTPFGAGSGLEGQAIPIHGGIVINFERMNKILDFSPEDMRITVQSGVTRMQLNRLAAKHDLMFSVDPGADAMIGGMVATNASGTTAVRYGAMRDQLLDLEVVLADGTIFHTGTKAKKSSSGYHLTGLFAGSEGTLGIITEVTLKLHSIPEYSMLARCTFDSLDMCAAAAQKMLQSGIQVLRMELIDAASIQLINHHSGEDFPVGHSLFLEFSGTKNAVEKEMRDASELMDGLGAENWISANDPLQKEVVWKARKELNYAISHLKGMEEIGGDICVPISRMPEMVSTARQYMDGSGLNGAIWGHVGDGNLHTSIMYNPKVKGEFELAEQTNDAIVMHAIQAGGTCTGEHGVGIGKMKFQQAEHGQALEVMKRMKQMYDPKGILNPGKIFVP
ncbi:FAD-binding oxidoreductase [Oceanobacillus massiliensis]|uniref:FAD-binding oxidoreductase n=1 Tax=Oceanobacillus massiliensis TaxID=1465765 RepID=UPI000288077D|nr:FAD-linked oxidase C-terminal domain-containing protein [Oceanobacillus massiliensis]